MKTYEKITLKQHHTKLYQVISETPILLFAREVDKEGEDKDFYNKEDVLVQIVHMIDKSLITKRVRMVIDKKYGELVPNILDDGTKVIDLIDQGEMHGMDNEEYPNDKEGHHSDFMVKQ